MTVVFAGAAITDPSSASANMKYVSGDNMVAKVASPVDGLEVWSRERVGETE